jgi:hypothetical protein
MFRAFDAFAAISRLLRRNVEMKSHTVIPLLAEALVAHGGPDLWRHAKGLSSTIVTGGQLWDIKNVQTPPIPRRVTTEFRRQWMQVRPFGEPDWTMIWVPDLVKITDGKGVVIAERENGRDAFDRSFAAAWDPLNLAYFNGYAMWTYHAMPFVLAEPGYEARAVADIATGETTLRGIAVRLPAHVHSHSTEQRFYFDESGLLARHDYEVDVWADSPAAHFVSDYVDVGGLKYPTKRSVFLRNLDGTPNRRVNTVTIDISDYELF